MTHQPRSTVLPLTSVPVRGFKSFLNAPVQTDLASLQADVAVLGIPYAIPYEMGQSRSASAPAYIREKSSRLARATTPHVGFDRAKSPGDLSRIRIVDCGDVPFDPVDMDGFETTFMPAVSHPEPGGLTFRESLDLLQRVGRQGPHRGNGLGRVRA